MSENNNRMSLVRKVNRLHTHLIHLRSLRKQTTLLFQTYSFFHTNCLTKTQSFRRRKRVSISRTFQYLNFQSNVRLAFQKQRKYQNSSENTCVFVVEFELSWVKSWPEFSRKDILIWFVIIRLLSRSVFNAVLSIFINFQMKFFFFTSTPFICDQLDSALT